MKRCRREASQEKIYNARMKGPKCAKCIAIKWTPNDEMNNKQAKKTLPVGFTAIVIITITIENMKYPNIKTNRKCVKRGLFPHRSPRIKMKH
jgi:hypothetical protein